jgi:hypothetical protein
LNNTLALASQVVEEKRTTSDQPSWIPNIVIKGKLYHKMPFSLMPPEGSTPRFAQIYVYDPEQDEGAKANTQLGHMTLPSGTTTQMKDKLLQLLTKLQQLLKKCNPYIQDCIQVCEIPADQVETMELVICPRTKTGHNHAGVYNQPTGFKEVQVLMEDSLTDKQHCIIIWNQRQDGAPQYISDIHRGFDALHYTLLFPQGEDSWYAGMPSSIINTSGQPIKQVSVHDFYAYHLHQREDERDSLFRSARLFQEYCCCAWSRIERQCLLYLMQNQETLRAESYNMLHDHINANDAIDEKHQCIGKAYPSRDVHWKSTVYECKIPGCNGYCAHSRKT